MVKITVNDRDWRNEWQRITQKATPEAIAATINTVALAAHKKSERNLDKEFMLRNQYTVRSLRYYQAKPNPKISRINAVTGSVSEYLPRQEEGATVRARKRAIPLPTLHARTGGKKAGVIAARHRMNRMGTLGSKSSKYFILSPGRNKSGYSSKRVKAGKHKASSVQQYRKYVLTEPAIFYRQSKRKLVKVRNLGVSHYVLKPRHWHSEAVKQFGKYSMYVQAYEREMRKRGVK